MPGIDKNEIFDGDLFNDAKKGAAALNSALEEISKTLDETSDKNVVDPKKIAADDKALKGLLLTLQEIEKTLNKMSGESGKAAQKIKPISVNPKDIQNAQRLIQLEERQRQVSTGLTTVQRERRRVQQQLARETARTVTNRSREFRELQRLREENRRYTQELRRETREQGVNANSMQGLINRTRRLVEARMNIDRSTREGRREFARLTREIVRNRDEMQRYNGQLNRTSGILGRLRGGFGGLNRVIGVFGASLGAGALLQKGITEFKEFESSITDVLTLLSESDRAKFGDTLTEGSIDIMKRFGLEIQDTNKALFDAISAGIDVGDSLEFLAGAAELAKGGGTDLGVAVDGITTVLNAFNLSGTEAKAVADSFFSAQQQGKTTVEELSSNFGKAASSANDLGASYQNVQAQAALLTLKGNDTAQAFTKINALQNKLIKPSEKSKKIFEKLGIEYGTVAVKAAGYENVLDKLHDAISRDANLTAQLFEDQNSLSAATTLLGENYEEYRGILTQVNEDTGENSSLSQAAALVMETQAEKSKRLNAQMTALAIQMGEKLLPVINAVKQGFVDFANFLIKNSKTVKFFAKILAGVTAGWIAFKIGTRLARIELTKTKLGTFISSLGRMRKTMILTAASMKKGSFSVRLFSTALKNIPILGWISALVTVISTLAIFSSSTEEAKDQQELFNESIEAGEAALAKQNEAEEDAASKRIAAARRAAEIRKAAGEDAEKVDAEFRQIQLGELQKSINTNRKRIEESDRQQLAAKQKQAEALSAINKEIEAASGSTFRDLFAPAVRQAELEALRLRKKAITDNFAATAGINEGVERKALVIIGDNQEKIKELRAEGVISAIEGEKGLTDAQKKELEKRRKLLVDFEKMIRNARIALIENFEEQEIAKRRATNADLIQAARVKAGKDRKLLEEFAELEKLLTEKTTKDVERIRKKHADKRIAEEKKTRDIIVGLIEDDDAQTLVKLENKHADELEALEKAREKQLFTEAEFIRRRDALLGKQEQETEETEDKIRLSAFDKKADEADLKEQEKFLSDSFETLEEFELKKQEFEDRMLARDIEREQKRLELLESTTDDQKKIAEQRKKILELQEKQLENSLKSEQEIRAANQEQLRELIESVNEFAEQQAERFVERLQKQIDALGTQFEASKKRQSELEALAKSGTVTASLAVEEKKQAELLREQEKRAKRQKDIEAALAIFKIFTANLDRATARSGGDKGADTGSALGKTAADTIQLFALIQNLPAFFQGTESVGDSIDGKKIPGATQDPYLIRVHGKERIFNDGQNNRIGNISNEEATRVLERYNKFGMMPGHDAPVHDGLMQKAAVAGSVIVQMHTDPQLLNEIKSMGSKIDNNTRAIKNIPRESLDTHIDVFQAIAVHVSETETKRVITDHQLPRLKGFLKWGQNNGYRG